MAHGPQQPGGGNCAHLMAVVLAIVAGGCHVGPNYRRPAAVFAADYIDTADPRIAPAPDAHAEWWHSFNDPTLNQLIQLAGRQNLTLRAAAMRIVEARARLGVARGNRFPQLQELFGEYGRVNLSGEVANPFPVNNFDNWGTGLNLAWELDFWGRFERAIEASDAALDASVHDYNDAHVILLADVARAYVRLRTFEERLRLAEENARIQQETLELAETKFSHGAVDELDVQQARQNLRQTEALIPQFRAGVRQSSNAICTLIGVPPGHLRDELGAATPIPEAPPSVAVGIPGELLSRRPDVRRAERRLAEQSAKIGVATAELYPRIALTGAIQLEADDLGDLFTGNALAGLIGPGLRWNVLNYGRIVNNIRAEDAVFDRMVYEYQQVVLNANREVEDALIGFLTSQERVDKLAESVEAAESSLRLVVNQYRGGLIEFGSVFVQQTELVSQQDQLAQARGDLSANLIEVYRALGGGWQSRPSTPQPGSSGRTVPPRSRPAGERPLDPMPYRVEPDVEDEVEPRAAPRLPAQATDLFAPN